MIYVMKRQKRMINIGFYEQRGAKKKRPAHLEVKVL